MNRFVRYALSAIALLAAPVLLMQGMANAKNPLSPMFSWNGYNLAELSLGAVRIEQGQGGTVSMSLRKRGVALARNAFAREPLAADALFVLAVHESDQRNPQAMAAILDGAYALDKRNRNIGALQLQQAALAGDFEATFRIIDRLASLYPPLSGEFVSPLIASLADPEATALIREALEARPVWAEAFWLSGPDDARLVRAMFDLRQQVDFGTSERSDAILLAGLVRQRLYEPAFAFWREVTGEPQGTLGYVADDAFAPFGWQLKASGDLSMTSREAGRFEVYVQNEMSGELGRQLLELAPGRYSFSASIAPVSEAENLSASLQCAQDDTPVGSPQTLDNAAGWTVTGGCKYYWLILTGAAWDRRDPLRVDVADMQFQAGN
ncbi:hypothetical protein GCM10009127_18270 [Alteraurantiacibacter aestuarii]|uniref:hypothetical protein n=1 Tax=Alteraurantiacibacter aestuarii TaxID=650004 RepID=UPI0031D6A299